MIRFTAALHWEFATNTGAVMAEGLGTPDCPQERWHGFDKEPWAGANDIHRGAGSSRKPTSGTI